MSSSAGKAVASGGSSSSQEFDFKLEEEPGHGSEQDLEQTFAELERARQELVTDGPGQTEDFKVSVLGGAWTKADRGMSYDAMQGAARRPPDLEALCVQFGLAKVSQGCSGQICR